MDLYDLLEQDPAAIAADEALIDMVCDDLLAMLPLDFN